MKLRGAAPDFKDYVGFVGIIRGGVVRLEGQKMKSVVKKVYCDRILVRV